MTFANQKTLLCALLLSLSGASSLNSQNLNASAELKLGIAAYQKARYEDAIEHLERAVTLDPAGKDGHLYLARAYDEAYVESPECGPGGCTANDHIGVRAREEFERVLEIDPSSTEALNGLAWRYYRGAQYEKAEQYYRQTLGLDPNDSEALYTLAVMQWQRSYQLRQEKRLELGLKRNESFIDSSACGAIRVQNLSRVEDAISLMMRVASLKKFYDAEVYLNVLHRERADIQCNDHAAYDQDMSIAREWMARACKTQQDPRRTKLICNSSHCAPPAPAPAPRGQPGSCPM